MILFLDCFCHGIWQSDSHRLKFNGNLTVTLSGSSSCEPDLLLSQSVMSWALESHIPHMVTENKTQLLGIYPLVQQCRYPPIWGCGTVLCLLNWGMYWVLGDHTAPSQNIISELVLQLQLYHEKQNFIFKQQGEQSNNKRTVILVDSREYGFSNFWSALTHFFLFSFRNSHFAKEGPVLGIGRLDGVENSTLGSDAHFFLPFSFSRQ